MSVISLILQIKNIFGFSFINIYFLETFGLFILTFNFYNIFEKIVLGNRTGYCSILFN